jgi:hypothetical protein
MLRPMLKLIALLFLAGAASAQTYDIDLTVDGNAYTGAFTYSVSGQEAIFTNVSISGGGFTLNIGEDLVPGTPGADGIWFINSKQQTLGIQLLSPLGGQSDAFADVYLNTTGTQAGQSWCNPGPSACPGLSLTEAVAQPLGTLARAPEIDAGAAGSALTLLGCCLLIFASKSTRP